LLDEEVFGQLSSGFVVHDLVGDGIDVGLEGAFTVLVFDEIFSLVVDDFADFFLSLKALVVEEGAVVDLVLAVLLADIYGGFSGTMLLLLAGIDRFLNLKFGVVVKSVINT
jgi:hypothetical protein